MTIVSQPEAPTSSPAQSEQRLTCEQVCNLPMGELLARVNGSLGTTKINEPKFFGYVTITRLGRITVYTSTNLGDDIRDAAIRFLITQHLDLPTHLFPDCFEVTRFSIPDSGGQA